MYLMLRLFNTFEIIDEKFFVLRFNWCFKI